MLNRKYDFNLLLQILNAVLCVLSIVIFLLKGGGYFDSWSILLSVLLFVETHALLLIEQRRTNPLLLLYSTLFILFFAARIPTLLFFNNSIVIDYNPFSASGMNLALSYLLFAHAAVSAGLIFSHKTYANREVRVNYNSRILFNSVMVGLGAVFLYHLASMSFAEYGKYTKVNVLLGYAGMLINPNLIFMSCVLLAVMLWKNLTARSVKLLLLFAVLIVLVRTLSGSRVGVFMLALAVFSSFLVVVERVRISARLLLITGVLVSFSFLLFFTASYMRWYHNSYNSYKVKYVRSKAMDVVNLSMVFNRLGYLDSTVDLVNNAGTYAAVINPVYYAKSIVDNALSPGFDVYDTPKAACALRYVYTKRPLPGIKAIIQEYHSDMFTVFGEYYILFGPFLSLAALFGVAWLFGRIYSMLGGAVCTVESCVYRALVLNVFYGWVATFGFDWMFIDFIILGIFVVICRVYFRYMKSRWELPAAG